jgi:hypothetical protein
MNGAPTPSTASGAKEHFVVPLMRGIGAYALHVAVAESLKVGVASIAMAPAGSIPALVDDEGPNGLETSLGCERRP